MRPPAGAGARPPPARLPCTDWNCGVRRAAPAPPRHGPAPAAPVCMQVKCIPAQTQRTRARPQALKHTRPRADPTCNHHPPSRLADVRYRQMPKHARRGAGPRAPCAPRRAAPSAAGACCGPLGHHRRGHLRPRHEGRMAGSETASLGQPIQQTLLVEAVVAIGARPASNSPYRSCHPVDASLAHESVAVTSPHIPMRKSRHTKKPRQTTVGRALKVGLALPVMLTATAWWRRVQAWKGACTMDQMRGWVRPRC